MSVFIKDQLKTYIKKKIREAFILLPISVCKTFFVVGFKFKKRCKSFLSHLLAKAQNSVP